MTSTDIKLKTGLLLFSALAPLLFSLYIADTPESISEKVCLRRYYGFSYPWKVFPRLEIAVDPRYKVHCNIYVTILHIFSLLLPFEFSVNIFKQLNFLLKMNTLGLKDVLGWKLIAIWHVDNTVLFKYTN